MAEPTPGPTGSNQATLRKWAAGLMIFSGISHPAQLLIYGTDDPRLVVGATIGSVWLFVGALLLTPKRAVLWMAAVLPFIAGLAASYKIIAQQPNVFTYVHAGIDFSVAALCVQCLRVPEPPAHLSSEDSN